MQIQSVDTAIVPQLFIKKGRRLIQIQPEQCGLVMDMYVGDRGVSEMKKPQIDLYNIDGVMIGYISYNGRVWLGDDKNHVEIKVGDTPTAAEMEARGWK